MLSIQYKINDYNFFLCKDKFGTYYITSQSDHHEILKYSDKEFAKNDAEFIAKAKNTKTYINYSIVKK